MFARFESREAMESYSNRENVAEFWSESKEDIKQMGGDVSCPTTKLTTLLTAREIQWQCVLLEED